MTHRNSGSAFHAACAACGSDDTELPSPRQWNDPPMGTRVDCIDCGATLTLVDYDYATDTGHAYQWEALAKSHAAVGREEG